MWLSLCSDNHSVRGKKLKVLCRFLLQEPGPSALWVSFSLQNVSAAPSSMVYACNKLCGNSRVKTHCEGKHLNPTKAFLRIKSRHTNNNLARPVVVLEETFSVQTKQELTSIFPFSDPSLNFIPGLVYE